MDVKLALISIMILSLLIAAGCSHAPTQQQLEQQKLQYLVNNGTQEQQVGGAPAPATPQPEQNATAQNQTAPPVVPPQTVQNQTAPAAANKTLQVPANATAPMNATASANVTMPENATAQANVTVPVQNQTAPAQTQLATIQQPVGMDAVGDTPLQNVLNYSTVHSFTYRRVTYPGGSPSLVTVTTGIAGDVYRGHIVLKLLSTYDSNGVQAQESMLINPISFKCVSFSKVVNGSAVPGVSCPQFGPSGTLRTSLNVNFLGYESITVSLGTFSQARKYVGDNVTYWSDGTRPLPIKYVVSNGSSVLETDELVSWS